MSGCARAAHRLGLSETIQLDRALARLNLRPGFANSARHSLLDRRSFAAAMRVARLLRGLLIEIHAEIQDLVDPASALQGAAPIYIYIYIYVRERSLSSSGAKRPECGVLGPIRSSDVKSRLPFGDRLATGAISLGENDIFLLTLLNRASDTWRCRRCFKLPFACESQSSRSLCYRPTSAWCGPRCRCSAFWLLLWTSPQARGNRQSDAASNPARRTTLKTNPS
jgi:hypothetical protein